MNKAALRKTLLQTRQSISIQEWQTKSLQLCEHLRSSPLFTQAQTILAYFSIRQEPDLSALFHLNKTWGFSRCVGKELIWHCWSPNALPLQTGALGIPEPCPNSPRIPPETVDLILVPAIACDAQGYRLGYGGGFYDRLLSSPLWSAKPTIGIVFEFARLPQLPRDAWDQPLHAVCTEAGFVWAN
ncbi:MAG: 5-formyltetrahydrofolate cyclo-ligase [Oscillatoriales cyanobacterium C42_A2020_001]|nr:5-formyltetrahydrofolate cyclo-ligase [Leptolyngbyaceae cyanobacterium C42_A2020_001]